MNRRAHWLIGRVHELDPDVPMSKSSGQIRFPGQAGVSCAINLTHASGGSQDLVRTESGTG